MGPLSLNELESETWLKLQKQQWSLARVIGPPPPYFTMLMHATPMEIRWRKREALQHGGICTHINMMTAKYNILKKWEIISYEGKKEKFRHFLSINYISASGDCIRELNPSFHISFVNNLPHFFVGNPSFHIKATFCIFGVTAFLRLKSLETWNYDIRYTPTHACRHSYSAKGCPKSFQDIK